MAQACPCNRLRERYIAKTAAANSIPQNGGNSAGDSDIAGIRRARKDRPRCSRRGNRSDPPFPHLRLAIGVIIDDPIRTRPRQGSEPWEHTNQGRRPPMEVAYESGRQLGKESRRRQLSVKRFQHGAGETTKNGRLGEGKTAYGRFTGGVRNRFSRNDR